jgi:integrase/recombinase XerD
MKHCLPGVKPIGHWSSANQGMYADFMDWLEKGGYGRSALLQYGLGARLSLGLLDKPYWLIDLEADVARVYDYMARAIPVEATRAAYAKGIRKLAEYLRLRCHRPVPTKQINWDHYLAGLPDWLAADLRSYFQHQQRGWRPEMHHRNALAFLSSLTLFFRWLARRQPLGSVLDLTPATWYDYLDEQLAVGVKPVTVNHRLGELQDFLGFLAEQGRPVCERTLRIPRLSEEQRLPKDVPADNLRRLLTQIEAEAGSLHAGLRRLGLMDRAWFLLMLHSGMRSGEVRRLLVGDCDLERRTIRIEQSKGLKDRVVYLTEGTVSALRGYLEVRGEAGTDHLFLYRHLPLRPTYCAHRLRTYAERCGVRIRPHQLRHSCATLLLNSGAPVLTVQTILGHKHVHTTLGYARLYDGTVAADYYQAMGQVERRLDVGAQEPKEVPGAGPLLAMVDALSVGTLNEAQRRTVQALRAALVARLEQQESTA